MSPLPLSVCFWDYDRTRPLLDGRVGIRGVSPSFTVLNPVAAFAKAFSTTEFDVTELSLAGQISAVAKENAVYQAIPVHLSRTFRHSIVYVRADAGIRSPADLKGRKVGIPDYDMTAGVIVRGMLRDEHHIRPEDIRWRIGGLTKAGEGVRHTRPMPGMDIETIDNTSLDSELTGGGLDAVITVHPPPSFVARDARTVRLFPDWRQAEQEYAQRTGQFPIMHVVGVRKTVLQKEPGVAQALYAAFERAKQLAIEDLEITQAPRVTLPWVVAELAATRRVLGDDFWPYGVRKNRATLETLLRYSYEEGLTPRLLTVEELFSADMLEL